MVALTTLGLAANANTIGELDRGVSVSVGVSVDFAGDGWRMALTVTASRASHRIASRRPAESVRCCNQNHVCFTLGMCTCIMRMLAGLSYSVGAKLRKGLKADQDGDAVANLRNAGAIPLAVTNTPELCCSVETFNGVTGYTCNPYDLKRSCGGSSGGEVSRIAVRSYAIPHTYVVRGAVWLRNECRILGDVAKISSRKKSRITTTDEW